MRNLSAYLWIWKKQVQAIFHLYLLYIDHWLDQTHFPLVSSIAPVRDPQKVSLESCNEAACICKYCYMFVG